jgi:hypothetical protein
METEPQSTEPVMVVPALQAVVVVELLEDELTELLEELDDFDELEDFEEDEVAAEELIEHSLLPPAIRLPKVSSEQTNEPLNTL